MTLETFAAGKIAEIAFEALIQTSVGKLTEVGITKSRELWGKIRSRLAGEPALTNALAEVENNQNREVLEAEVVPFLQVEMLKDKDFAQEIKVLAQQVNQEFRAGSQDNITMTGTANDSSTLKQVGKIEGNNVSF